MWHFLRAECILRRPLASTMQPMWPPLGGMCAGSRALGLGLGCTGLVHFVQVHSMVLSAFRQQQSVAGVAGHNGRWQHGL